MNQRSLFTVFFLILLISFVLSCGEEESPPVVPIWTIEISNIDLSSTFHTATIGFTTSLPTKAQIEYDISSDTLRNIVPDTLDFIKNHTVTITGLSEGTDYNYRIRVWNADSTLENTSPQDVFSTADSSNLPDGPNISGFELHSETTSSVVADWNTDIAADSRVFWGLSENTFTDSMSETELLTNHYITVPGLEDNTTYYFRVASEDSEGNRSYSATKFATTLEIQPPPEITDVEVVFTTGSSASILWYTNRISDSRVWYSTDSTSLTNFKFNDSVFDTTHYMGINGLLSDTKYYFKVMSNTLDNQITESDTFSFTTKPVLRIICPDTLITLGTDDPYPTLDYPIYIQDSNDLFGLEIDINYDRTGAYIIPPAISRGNWTDDCDYFLWDTEHNLGNRTIRAAVAWSINYQPDTNIQRGTNADGDGDLFILHFQTAGEVTDSIRVIDTQNGANDALGQNLSVEFINGSITVVRE